MTKYPNRSAAKIIQRRLQSRKLPPPPKPAAPEPHWAEVAIQAAEDERLRREAERVDETRSRVIAEARSAPIAEVIAAAMGAKPKPSNVIPLNGAAIIRAALAGGHGTVNGE